MLHEISQQVKQTSSLVLYLSCKFSQNTLLNKTLKQ